MFKIPQIDKGQLIIDRSMDAMSEFAQKERGKIGERFAKNVSSQRKSSDDNNLNKRKDLELQKIRFLNKSIQNRLKKIIQTFPNFSKLDEIYIQLINTSPVPVKDITDSLSLLTWIVDTSEEFTEKTEFKIKRANSQDTVGFLMKKYLGKVNSLFRKNKNHFTQLDEARKFMNRLPKFEDMYTVAIGGYPNVGKSTLMKKITGSNVEIQNYPFTTKGLMFSYLNYNNKKIIQMIDTPGLLGREKNNEIEERASIILHRYCQKILFVLDVTQSCGYDINVQLKLLKQVSNSNTELVIYLSKMDIYNEEDEERLQEIQSKIKKYKIFKDSNEIKEKLVTQYLSTKQKFDPSKLKVIK
jgi:nucleolar GTP-binding protein